MIREEGRDAPPGCPLAPRTRPARVVIAGGGFGGYHAARTLERLLDRERASLVLVANTNYLLYTPFLSAVAGGLREPRHITFPLRELLPATDVRVVEVESAVPEKGSLQVRNLQGKREDLAYDHLIVSLYTLVVKHSDGSSRARRRACRRRRRPL